MAVLDGFHTVTAIAGDINARLTVGLSMLEFDWWPAHESMAGPLTGEVLDEHWPVAANPRDIDGVLAYRFSDDWYHRIHLIPRELALGNLVSDQVEEVHVWNAYLVPQTLNGIDGLDEGITLDGPDDFPLVFGALQLTMWEISFDQDGPSTIDISITWDFEGIPDAALGVTGVRVVAFTLAPDWTQGVRERLAWETDVLPSESGVEQRRSVRLSPRRSFVAPLILEGRERSFCDLMIHGWGSRVWALPIWPDVQRLGTPVALGASAITCATTGRDFREGGLAMLRGESAFVSETVEILAVTGGGLTLVRPTLQAWPGGTRLYPVRTARFPSQPSVRRLTDQAIAVQAEFVTVEASDWPSLELPTYRDFPVFDDRPDESEDLTSTFERMERLLDNLTGIPYVLDTAEVAMDVQGHRWKLDGIDERAEYRSLLYTLAGRRVAVWVPTHYSDLVATATISSSATAIEIEHVGYTRFGQGQLGRRDIRIQLRDGTVFYRRITGAAEIDADTEQVSIDSALGQVVEPAEIDRISFMMLARSASDAAEILHLTDVQGVATSSLSFRSVRDEL